MFKTILKQIFWIILICLTNNYCNKINNLVGYSPKVDIKVGMDHFIDWYMEFYKND